MGRRKVLITKNELGIEGKICSLHKEWTPLTEYSYDRTNKRYKNICKECDKLRKRTITNKNPFKERAQHVIRNAKYKNRFVEENIEEILEQIWEQQNGNCYYTGMPMSLYVKDEYFQICWSVDRKDSNKGYSKENIALCFNFINKLKSDMPYDVFIKILNVDGYVEYLQAKISPFGELK